MSKDHNHAFDEIANLYRVDTGETALKARKRTAQNPATAGGILLIITAMLAAIVWAAGVDRFLWVTAVWLALGTVLTIAGTITTAATKRRKGRDDE